MESILFKSTKIVINNDEKWQNNLQAGILKSNGRDNLFLIFLRFNYDVIQDVKKILSKVNITSAIEQSKQTQSNVNNLTVTNIYLSYKGYHALQISIKKENCQAFVQGMSERMEENEDGKKVHMLNDEPEKWEEVFQSDIHAVLSLANDDIQVLKKEVASYKKIFKGRIEIIAEEKGKVYRNKYNRPIEHFGYVDGISQPIFIKKDFDDIDTTNWNPEAPLELVLVNDIGTNEVDCLGSYMVFRKLEQNVKGFKEAEKSLAEDLHFTGSSEEAAGAMVIGRFENGLPAIKFGSTASPNEDKIDNNFNYSFDPEGSRCPFHSHIRKVNPRGDNSRLFGITEAEERSHRIVRRGITYGERNQDANKEFKEGDKNADKVGLLFICFQSNIENQFEFIQRTWANNNDFPVPFTGIDPVIGQGENRRYSKKKYLEQPWKKSNGSKLAKSFSSFVTNKGGEYFFAPSIPFFKSLATNNLSL